MGPVSAHRSGILLTRSHPPLSRRTRLCPGTQVGRFKRPTEGVEGVRAR